MGRQQSVYRIEPPRFPEDFPQRLERFKETSGLSWRELARRLRIDIRIVNRWRNGSRPDSANLMALFNLAAGLGLLHLLLPEADKCRCASMDVNLQWTGSGGQLTAGTLMHEVDPERCSGGPLQGRAE